MHRAAKNPQATERCLRRRKNSHSPTHTGRRARMGRGERAISKAQERRLWLTACLRGAAPKPLARIGIAHIKKRREGAQLRRRADKAEDIIPRKPEAEATQRELGPWLGAHSAYRLSARPSREKQCGSGQAVPMAAACSGRSR